MSRTIPMAAGILAGGKSTRMGASKSFLRWQSTTFLEHILSLFADFSQCMVSVDRIEKFEAAVSPAVTLVEDVRKDYGPLEGLYRLLGASGEDKVFVAATDMPLLNREFILAFAAADMGAADIMIASGSEKYHPLCGIYKKSCLPLLEELFRQKRHSVKSLLDAAECKKLAVKDLGFSEKLLSNVNTKQEYEELKRNLEGPICGLQ